MNEVTTAGDCGTPVRNGRSHVRRLAGGLALSLLLAAAPAGRSWKIFAWALAG